MTRAEIARKIQESLDGILYGDELAEIQRQISDHEIALEELREGADPKEVVEGILGWDTSGMTFDADA